MADGNIRVNSLDQQTDSYCYFDESHCKNGGMENIPATKLAKLMLLWKLPKMYL